MSTLVRKHSLTAGTIDALAVTRVHEETVVTAVRNGSGSLELIAWRVDGTALQRAGEATGGPVDDVSICQVGFTRVATACRDGDSGKLTLALWELSPDGQLHQTDSAGAGTMSKAAAVGLDDTLLATPLIDAAGNLKVIAWVVSDDGKLTRGDDGSGGGVSSIATAQWGGGRFVTAVRNASDKLELIQWDVQPDGEVERLGEATAGTVGSLDVIRNRFVFDANAQEFITAVSDSNSKLKLIAWEVRLDGSIHRLGDLTGSSCSKPSLGHVGGTRYVVAHRGPEGKLRVQSFRWGTTPSGVGEFELIESASAGTASLVRATDPGQSGSLITALRNGSGDLQVILWALE